LTVPHAGLTDYEAAQVGEISAWKSEIPSRISWTLERVREPLGIILSKAVPGSTLASLIEKAEALLDPATSIREIVGRARVASIEDLRTGSLEICDGLALDVSVRAQREAMLQGAAVGLGGPAGDVFFLAVLMAAAMRAVRRVGHCYGYRLETPIDKQYVLGILELSTVEDPAQRLSLLSRVQRLAQGAEAFEPLIGLDGVKKALAKDFAVKSVPVVGDLAALALDYSFVRRAAVTSRRVFQERWLSTGGKIDEISPASSSKRGQTLQLASEVTGAIAYMGTYAAGFASALPVAATWRLVNGIRITASLMMREVPLRPSSQPETESVRVRRSGEFRERVTIIHADKHVCAYGEAADRQPRTDLGTVLQPSRSKSEDGPSQTHDVALVARSDATPACACRTQLKSKFERPVYGPKETVSQDEF
jgi:hypothetical protein